MQRTGKKYHEMDVYLTDSDKPYRLVPDSVYRQRLERWQKENSGKEIGKEQKVRLHLNAYVTNVSSDVLPAEYVFKLHSIRWQIELVFKIWKSVFKLHTCSGMNTERYLTTLYARLLLVLLDWHIFYIRRKEVYEQYKVFLSPNKCMKHLYLHSQTIRNALRKGNLVEVEAEVTTDWWRLCPLDGQKKERSYTKIIDVR